MPTVDVFVAKKKHSRLVQKGCKALKKLIAEELSCNDRQLKPDEVSIRIVRVDSPQGMLANIELNMSAANYPQRVERQDRICFNVAEWMSDFAGVEAKAWLALSELGHSHV